MKATYIFVDNRFCITLDDFIDTLNKNKDNIERLSLCIAPLIQDGIIMEWLAYLGETGDQLLKIIKKIYR